MMAEITGSLQLTFARKKTMTSAFTCGRTGTRFPGNILETQLYNYCVLSNSIEGFTLKVFIQKEPCGEGGMIFKEWGRRLMSPLSKQPDIRTDGGAEVEGEEDEDNITVGEPEEVAEGVVVRLEDTAGIADITSIVEKKLDASMLVGEPIVLEESVRVTMDVDEPSELGLKGLPIELHNALVTSGFRREQVEPSLERMYGKYMEKHLETSVSNASFSACKQNAIVESYRRVSLDEMVAKGNPRKIHSNICKIDAGSQGEVFKATDVSGAAVALKKITIKSESDLPVLENEISLLHTCKHPNIVEYKACYKEGQNIWISMELMDGGKLTNIIQTGKRLTEPQVAFIMREILKGVRYLHKGGVLHRDIKSDNVLLSSNGSIKLTDFGFSTLVSTGNAAKRRTLVGTPFWMAPEVVDSKPYDYAADIWSLGILGFELCDGQPPYIDMHPMRAMKLTSKRDAPKLKSRTEWSFECITFMESMLSKQPASRPTAKELLQHPFLVRAEGTDAGFLKELLG